MKKGKKYQVGGADLKKRYDVPQEYIKPEPPKELQGDLQDNPFLKYLLDQQYQKGAPQNPNLEYSMDFQNLNTGLDFVRGIANTVSSAKALRDETRQYLDSIRPRPHFNKDEEGLNNLSVYYKTGGRTFQNGGASSTRARSPITVTNPNDPRLKAYSDSLNLYNAGEFTKQQLDKLPKTRVALVDWEKIVNNGMNEKAGKAKTDLFKINGKYPEPINQTPPVDVYHNGNVVGPARANQFKKPVQPVVYQKPQQYFNFNGVKMSQTDYDYYKKHLDPKLGINRSSHTQNQDDINDDKFLDKYKVPVKKWTNEYGLQSTERQWGDIGDIKPWIDKPKQEQLYPLQPAVKGTINIKSPQQEQIPEPQGQPVYGPSNGLIGYQTSTGFQATLRRDHLSKANQADIELLNNPQAMSEYTKNTPRYQIGGINPKNIAELEKSEVYKDIAGNIKKIGADEPSHEQGGSDQPFVFKVLENTATRRNDEDSANLRIAPLEMMDMFGIKTKGSISHSKAFDIATEAAHKDVNRVQGGLKKTSSVLDTNPNDNYAKNSLKLNFNQLEKIPTANDVFETLFNHQEMLKQKYNIDNEKEKGQYGINPYKGDRNYKGNASKYTPEQWNDFAKQLGFKGNGNQEFQTFLFNLNGDQGTPNVQQDIMDLHQKYGDPNPKGTQGTIQNWLDGRLGHRWDVVFDKYYNKNNTPDPNNNDYSIDYGNDLTAGPQDNTNPPVAGQGAPSDNYNFQFLKQQGDVQSKFNEPLHWYDTATPVASFIDALGRKPVKYDGVNLVEPKAKYLNPLPTLQEGQADFNAATDILPKNGVGFGNLAGLYAKKYGFNNKVLGDYQNANNQIWNSNEHEVVGVRNQQQQADLQARQMFEQKQLQGLENQRQQLFRSMNDITTTVAQNAKLNREGNLLMKLFPNFTQTGDYNGKRYNFQNPNGNNPYLQQLYQQQVQQKATKKK